MGLLDQASKRLLERLRLSVRPNASGLGQGIHRSKMRAAGLEFADHRMYVPGDDIRHIDWKAFARHKQLLLKTFEEERDVYIYVLLDVSDSMTRGEPSKIEIGKSLAAAFSYLGMKQFDRVRLIPFSKDLGQEHAPARNKAGYPQLERQIAELDAEGITNFAETTRSFAERFPRHGLVVVVSDLMDPSDWGESFRTLGRLGHDLWVVHVHCKEDTSPDFQGELELKDAETGQNLRVRISKNILESYRREVESHIESCHEACKKIGGRFVEASVEMELEDLLKTVLASSAEAR